MPLILVISVLTIYLVWKLMTPGKRKKTEQRRFSVRKHRFKKIGDNDEE